MQQRIWLGLSALVAMGVAGTAIAGSPINLAAAPGVYDPDNLGHVSAAWETKEGLPDAGRSDHALVLYKLGDSSENSAAGAVINGVEGLTVQASDPVTGSPYEFGFDIRADSHIGAGSPRFNLVASDGFHFIGGAANGTVVGTTTDRRGNLWYRVRFDAQNFAQAFPPVTPGAVIQELVLIVDEGASEPDPNAGQYILDNIAVDPAEGPEVLIGRPGKNGS